MPDLDPKDPLDLSKILLPKKEGPSLDSAQRVNAGALLAQEQTAAEQTPVAPAAAPVAPAQPKKDEPTVQPLQTYKSDIESLVQQGGVSEVSIAAAEAVRKEEKRKEGGAAPVVAAPQKRSGLIWAYTVGGAVLALGALGLVAFVATRPTTVPVAQGGAYPSIIFVDAVRPVPIAGPRAEVMSTLVSAQERTRLALGLIARLYVTPAPAAAEPAPYPIQDLLALFAPHIPVELLRTLKPEYLLGVHSFDSNQPFLLLRPDSYDVAYRGMLQWEISMRADLAPLFNRKPPVRLRPIDDTPVVVATSTTPTTTPEEEPVTAVLNSGFVDRIIENRDTRVVETTEGDIVLLWLFIDRGTLLITTNETTMREVISRIAHAPIISLPQ